MQSAEKRKDRKNGLRRKPNGEYRALTLKRNIQIRLASFRESIVNKEKAGFLTRNVKNFKRYLQLRDSS
ncbi:hypothetical protein ASG33_11245 [Dyadobacter sp. Leaf189]|nr:hypothetical protein ASG33_11245 [Dyadobacter sp. Leaf189]